MSKKIKKSLVFKSNINWGAPINALDYFVLSLTIIFFYEIISALFFSPIIIIFAVPLIILNVLFYPVTKTNIMYLLKKDFSKFKLYTQGVEVNDKFIEWKNVRGISFNSGRTREENFTKLSGLPVLQKIFVVGNDYKEFSCIIDIDYSYKLNREKNNQSQIKELLYGMNKIDLVGDWAHSMKKEIVKKGKKNEK